MWKVAEAVVAMFGILIVATLVVGFCEGFVRAHREFRASRRLVSSLWIQGQLEALWQMDCAEEE